MAGYDYGNARIKAMKSHLLSARQIESLAEAGSIRGLISALVKTAYHQEIEAALVHTSGINCIETALRENLTNTLGKTRRFYNGHAGQAVSMVLRRYDLHNLKSILRGLAKNIAPDEILRTVLPVNELTLDILQELARAANVRTAVDILATLNLPLALPILWLRAQRPNAEISHMELALEQWYYQQCEQFLESASRDEPILAAWLKIQADLANLNTVLRCASATEEREALQEWLESEDLGAFFLGPGYLPLDLLIQASQQDTLEAAVETLAGTAYQDTLRNALRTFNRSGRLSVFEQDLRRYYSSWTTKQGLGDPLGIGVLLSYLALKTNEVRDIRWIAQGVHLGFDLRDIKEELET
jgi:V/A-type H+-transporting ATPase subunit C